METQVFGFLREREKGFWVNVRKMQVRFDVIKWLKWILFNNNNNKSKWKSQVHSHMENNLGAHIHKSSQSRTDGLGLNCSCLPWHYWQQQIFHPSYSCWELLVLEANSQVTLCLVRSATCWSYQKIVQDVVLWLKSLEIPLWCANRNTHLLQTLITGLRHQSENWGHTFNIS